MHKIKVTMDGLGETFEAYWDGRYWNGWVCPNFDKDEAERLTKHITNQGYQVISYDEPTDIFICIIGNDNVPIEMWTGYDIETEDGTKHLYPIGAGYWIWEEII